MTFRPVVGWIAAVLLGCFLGGCGEKEEEKYVRPSPGCKCVSKSDGAKCQCNHCMGEKAKGKDPRCYCGEGDCGCGPTKTKCACGHCQGEADDPKCACKK